MLTFYMHFFIFSERLSGSFLLDLEMEVEINMEVEVDMETGKLDLLRVVSATDVGQIIDPPSLEGQLHGSLGAAGIDTAIFEESVLDRNSGHILNPNMMDYKWRSFPELPRFDNMILETPIQTHRYQAVGVGEISTSLGPSAVLMAASNAVGKRLDAYPLTPDRMLRALGKINPVGKGEEE